MKHTLLKKTESLLGELTSLKPCGARLVGSQALRAAEATSATPGSDIDFHVIVNDLETITLPDILGMPKDINLGDYDILAVKIKYMMELFSVHVYSFALFKDFCRLAPRQVRILRNTRGKTDFIGYGLGRNIPCHITMKRFHEKLPVLYEAEYIHKPIVNGQLYMLPYQSMALSGLTLFDNAGLDNERRRCVSSIIRYLQNSKKIQRATNLVNISKKLYGAERIMMDEYKDMFVS